MNRDDIITLGKQAGFTDGDFASFTDLIVHFGTLVAQHEREACAKVCVHNAELYASPNVGWESSMECASAIRARGEEPELESVTYPTAGCFLEEGWYSAEDLQDILKSLEDLNSGDDYA